MAFIGANMPDILLANYTKKQYAQLAKRAIAVMLLIESNITIAQFKSTMGFSKKELNEYLAAITIGEVGVTSNTKLTRSISSIIQELESLTEKKPNLIEIEEKIKDE